MRARIFDMDCIILPFIRENAPPHKRSDRSAARVRSASGWRSRLLSKEERRLPVGMAAARPAVEIRSLSVSRHTQ